MFGITRAATARTTFRAKAPQSIISIGLLLLAGCSETPALRVDDVSFLADRLRGLSAEQVDRLVALTALGIAASQSDFDRVGEADLRRGEEDLRIRALRDRLALAGAGIDEPALRARYLNDPEPELVVRHLVILSERWRSEEHRSSARARARSGLDRYRAGEPFSTVAGSLSEEPGASARGGLLGPGRAGTWVREFWEAAVALSPGEVSDVVETPYGFHLLQLEERRIVPFDDARASFESRVASEVDDPVEWERLVLEWIEDDSNRMDGPVPIGDTLRRRAILAEAARRGVVPDSGELHRLALDWAVLAGGWAAALGFSEGMNAAEISDTAMAALGRTDQNARIVREEVMNRLASFLDAYPVEDPTS